MMVVPRRSPDRCPWRSPLLVRTALGHCCARTRYFRTVPASSSCVWFATTFLFRGRCYPADTPASARFASVSFCKTYILEQMYAYLASPISGKLDRCPMCRAAITSYFCIRSEEYVPPNAIESKVNSKSKVAVHWLDALNDRLTDFLGFR